MLQIKDLTKSYGRRKVLDDLSLSLQTGEITALIGLNGSGKTTLMKAIMQLIPYQKGQIFLDDRPLTKADFHRITLLPDRLAVQKSMSIHQALAFMNSFYPTYNDDRAKKIMDFLT